MASGIVHAREQAATLRRASEKLPRVAFEVSTTKGGFDDATVPELRMGHLGLREHLQQQPLDFHVGLVGLVHQQHRGPRRRIARSRGLRASRNSSLKHVVAHRVRSSPAVLPVLLVCAACRAWMRSSCLR
jgi:hypothetical protein